MEKSREELIDNKTEQRALKVRKVLAKTKEWGQNLAVALLAAAFVLMVIMVCATLWKLGLGFFVILAGVALVAMVVWMWLDIWSDTELEKARYRRYKETREED